MTKYYSGIGSRETPDNILTIMEDVASYLAGLDFTLRSGAASGADSAFEDGCNRVNGPKEIYLPWEGYNFSKSELNPAKYPFSQEEKDFAARMHPAWNKCSPSARLLHQRNTRILIGIEAVHGSEVKASSFIICWIASGSITGGTGQALRIAQHIGLPVFNFGLCKSLKELEQMLLDIDEYQKTIINNE